MAALLATTLAASTAGQAQVGLVVAGAVLGLGMGTIYPDLLGRCFTEPDGGDGSSADHVTASVVMAEAVGTALVTVVAFTWLGTGFGQVAAPDHRAQILYAVLLALTPVMIVQLSRSSRTPQDPRAQVLARRGWGGAADVPGVEFVGHAGARGGDERRTACRRHRRRTRGRRAARGVRAP